MILTDIRKVPPPPPHCSVASDAVGYCEKMRRSFVVLELHVFRTWTGTFPYTFQQKLLQEGKITVSIRYQWKHVGSHQTNLTKLSKFPILLTHTAQKWCCMTCGHMAWRNSCAHTCSNYTRTPLRRLFLQWKKLRTQCSEISCENQCSKINMLRLIYGIQRL